MLKGFTNGWTGFCHICGHVVTVKSGYANTGMVVCERCNGLLDKTPKVTKEYLCNVAKNMYDYLPLINVCKALERMLKEK
jgi:hypothetical protein